MLTDRDNQIIKFVGTFGKSYVEVFAKTFFAGTSEQVARNRVNKLVNQDKVLKHVSTGLSKPRFFLALTEYGREIAEDMGIETVKSPHFAMSTVKHNMLEQIAFFWISQIREITRTTVKSHSKAGFSHTPDMVFSSASGKRVYVECEVTKKTGKRYGDIFVAMLRDDVEMVLYVMNDDAEMARIAKVMPPFDRLRFTTVDRLISSITQDKKISSLKQIDVIQGG